MDLLTRGSDETKSYLLDNICGRQSSSFNCYPNKANPALQTWHLLTTIEVEDMGQQSSSTAVNYEEQIGKSCMLFCKLHSRIPVRFESHFLTLIVDRTLLYLSCWKIHVAHLGGTIANVQTKTEPGTVSSVYYFDTDNQLLNCTGSAASDCPDQTQKLNKLKQDVRF